MSFMGKDGELWVDFQHNEADPEMGRHPPYKGKGLY